MIERKYIAQLQLDLDEAFSKDPKPSSLFDASEWTRRRYAEFAKLEALNWDNAVPDDLSDAYEASTYVSTEGYRYMIPRIFRICRRLRESDDQLDFIAVFFVLPTLCGRDDLFLNYSGSEKRLVWDFLRCGSALIGMEQYDDDELDSTPIAALRARLDVM